MRYIGMLAIAALAIACIVLICIAMHDDVVLMLGFLFAVCFCAVYPFIHFRKDRKESEAAENRMRLILGHIANSDILKNCRAERKGSSAIFVHLYDSASLRQMFSITLIGNRVVFKAFRHDLINGRTVERKLELAGFDDDGLYDAALRHLGDSHFIHTLTPFSREVNVKA